MVKEKKPTVVSTFAGGGGSSLGYKLAGFHELLATDFNADACAVLRLNFPELTVLEKDIRELTVTEVLQAANLNPGELDVFDGSPPCQGFSMSNKNRGRVVSKRHGVDIVTDPRNGLFQDYLRLIKGVQPRAFVMENVQGMTTGKMHGVFNFILDSMREMPYVVKVKIMNAKYYGVAHNRPRTIFIGIRKDLGIEPTFPERVSRPIPLGAVTQDVDLGDGKKRSGLVSVMANVVRPGGTFASYHSRKHFFNQSKLNVLKLAPAITKTNNSWTPDGRSHFGAAALKRMAGFPDDFRFDLPDKDEHTVATHIIGNCVPPPMMRAIAENLKNQLYPEIAPRRPRTSQKKGAIER